MLKRIFKAMWYGANNFYEQNRDLFSIFSLFANIAITLAVIKLVGKCIGFCDGCIALIGIVAAILVTIISFSYSHLKDAEKYMQKHNVTLKEAWVATTPHDDCF